MVCTILRLRAGGILQTPLINCKPGCIKDLHERWFWWRNIADCTCWSAKCPKSKLEVVYNGIVENEPALEPVVLKSDGVSIGMAGRLDAIKGLNFLIKSYSGSQEACG